MKSISAASDWLNVKRTIVQEETVRRGLFGVLTLFAFIATVSSVFALTPAKKLQEPGTPQGISSVTDAAGNPIDLDAHAVLDAKSGNWRDMLIQRGQAWWPYKTPLAAYTVVDKPAELMTEDQIMVNGVATLSVHNPKTVLSLMPSDLLLAEESQLRQTDGFYLVKIAGFSRTQEQIDALKAAGAVLGEYLNINTYIAKIPTSAYGAVKALPFVTFIGDYHPVYKISPSLGLSKVPSTDVYDFDTHVMKPWTFEVMLHQGADAQDVFDGLARLGLFPRAEDLAVSEAVTTLYIEADPSMVTAIAGIPGVKFISEHVPMKLMASSTNPAAIPMILQNNGVFTTNKATGWKLWNAGIDGTGNGGTAPVQIITMQDSGLNTKMEHFAQDTLNNGTVGPAHRKVVGYDNVGGDVCVLDNSSTDGGHGAKTSQHAAGSISNMTANPDTTHTPTENFDDGIARGAKIYFQDVGLSNGNLSVPLDEGPSITSAIGKGSFIQNYSFGNSSNTYTTQTINLDTALFNNPNFLVTISSGNSGAGGTSSIGEPGNSKNAVVVGGNDASSPSNIYINCSWDGLAACSGSLDLGSSRGPVTSSRIKPDIMSYIWATSTVGGEQMAYDAPTAMCQTDATKTVYWNYTNSGGEGGTSFAAPDVAGLAALTRDYFLQGFYPTGVATGANTLTPSGSLVKAVLLASGEDMAATATPTSSIAIGKRYSSDVGYGRVNLPAVLHIGSSAPFLWVQNNVTLGQSVTQTFFYTINGNSIPLRIIMDWYDSSGSAIVKNADLRVTIGANVYRGNVFSGGWSTTGGVADATNNTEGFFLDAAHGLPSSGTVQVEVIGTNNPGGMNYSMAVSGDVTSAAVTQVALDKGTYTCSQDVKVTVNDTGATSPVNVTLTSRNSLSTVIDTKNVVCTGSNGVFTGIIHTGTGITVASGGSITATYGAVTPATATINCLAALANGGSSIAGGCDNSSAGTSIVTGPLFNGSVNEFFTKYMDAGEYSSYTFKFTNQTGVALTDATVTLSFSGAGASKMTAYNSPIHVGAVPVNGTAGAVFQVFTDPTTAGLTAVNMDFSVTSPADGYTAPTNITQVQLLQANDVVARQGQCNTFNTGAEFVASPGTSTTAWYESVIGAHPTNPWRWSGSASTPSTVSSENRNDGTAPTKCSSTTANAALMTGNSGIGGASNFTGNADSFALRTFQPALTGNGPSGQPYHYTWEWHSFYHASETLNQTTGVWGPFYNDQWNSATPPTGDQAKNFPISLGGYFYQTIFDNVGTWNWETANTGTPDNPEAAVPPPNQFIATFTGVTGLATSSTWFAYGHEHADLTVFGGASTAATRRDIALDNNQLVYDEYYAAAQAGASCGGAQVGQVAFDQGTYAQCPTGTAVLSVTDANASGTLTVTVTSPGTGDSEVVTLTQSGATPYFSGTLTLSTSTGRGNNNGTLLVLPSETISATYNDSSPVGSTTATATTGCTGGNVIYVTNAQASDNGDNDGIPDNGEDVTLDVTIQNNLSSSLTNTKVTISSSSSTVDCIPDNQALYGTVAAGANATNPASDRFRFHVNPSVACSDPSNPPTATFTVLITGDGFDGSSTLQTFTLNLDLNIGAGTATYTQAFASDPGWSVGITSPDNSGCTANSYKNEFHWCALCGNAGGGYGAWTGNSAFGTSGQNYSAAYDSSTLFSPVFTAGSTAVTMKFDVAYRTEATFDGAIVQYKLGAGNWTTLGYTTPAQAATTTSNFCSPILASTTAWTGTATGTAWTTSNAASVTTTNGQSLQFRWRLGGDSTNAGTTYGGLGVDNVVVTGLRQFVCEPNRNSSLPVCPAACATALNGTPCDDGNACTTGETCQAGACTPASTTTCSASDSCHVAGTCNPQSGLCSNPVAPSGTSCGPAPGQCENQDTCNSTGTCVDNGFKSASSSCTGASQGGQCDNDAADHCTGTSNACVDVFRSAATSCTGTSNGGACDGADHCSGTNASCVDVFLSSSTTCRASTGQCDVAETCTGTSGACPADAVASAATSCTGTSQGGACDGADHCSGTDTTCIDVYQAAGFTCRASAGQCDVAETCTGTSGACPADGFASNTTSCTGTSQSGACDNDAADRCSGTANTCVDAYQASGFTCRASAGQCDVAETCTGNSGSCPADGFASSSTGCTGASQGGSCDNDAADHCSGTANTCVDAYASSSTSCTGASQAGGCDNDAADHCSGTSSSCVDAYQASGFTCRASAGQCDVAETCDGSTGACPADVFASSSTSCTGASQGGQCDNDAADHCTGTSNSCVDVYASSSTSCTGASQAGGCDNDAADHCSGTSGSCVDVYQASGFTCRASAGQCDVAETCDGSTGACPADVFASPSTSCTGASQGGSCDNDAADHCIGTSNSCVDVYQASGFTCRASAGQCDVAETCTGSSGSCPADVFASSSTSCTGASQGGSCDNDAADHCTGTSNSCVDVYQASGFTCRASTGQCDAAETCDGSSGSCPADVVASASTSCTGTSQGGACDGADHCSGVDGSCIDVYQPSGFTCRASTGQCDVAETCTGTSGACPADAFQPAGTTCDDGFGCTISDQCNGLGACAGSAKSCSDGNVCTADSCSEPFGTCDNSQPSGACNITGHVYYYRESSGATEPSTKPVAGEDVVRNSSLEGSQTSTTDSTGTYGFSSEAGNITLTPSQVRLLTDETECRAATTAADATEIAKAAVSLVTLTPNQRLAGDVSNNSAVTGFDAALVSQRAVASSCVNYHYPVRNATGSDWAMRPVSQSYSPLTSSANADFYGVLYGDVTGNWAPPTLLRSTGSALREEGPALITDSSVGNQFTPIPNSGATLTLVSGPQQNPDGSWKIVVGLLNSNGIIALDMKLKYDATSLHVRSVAATGIGSNLTVVGNDLGGGVYPLTMFGPNPLQGSGSLLTITYVPTRTLSGQPFTVNATANEGQIPIVRSPALNGGGSSLHPGGPIAQ